MLPFPGTSDDPIERRKQKKCTVSFYSHKRHEAGGVACGKPLCNVIYLSVSSHASVHVQCAPCAGNHGLISAVFVGGKEWDLVLYTWMYGMLQAAVKNIDVDQDLFVECVKVVLLFQCVIVGLCLYF